MLFRTGSFNQRNECTGSCTLHCRDSMTLHLNNLALMTCYLLNIERPTQHPHQRIGSTSRHRDIECCSCVREHHLEGQSTKPCRRRRNNKARTRGKPSLGRTASQPNCRPGRLVVLRPVEILEYKLPTRQSGNDYLRDGTEAHIILVSVVLQARM